MEKILSDNEVHLKNNLLGSISNFTNRIHQLILAIPYDILILKLTLIFTFSFTKSFWLINYPIKFLAALMLISNSLVKNKMLWFLIVFGTLFINASEWFSIDNHKYLASYWTLTCFIGLFMTDTLSYLKFNARMAIGLCFLFAALWKIYGGQYIDGQFFHFTMLTDDRFENFAGYLADFNPEVLPHNRFLTTSVARLPLDYPSANLISHPNIERAALLISWWTIFIESLVAFAFLVSIKNNILYRFRDYFLLIFIVSTYSLVSVAGFNYILVLLGISQLEVKNKKNLAILYGVILFWTEAKKWPWSRYLFYVNQDLYNFIF